MKLALAVLALVAIAAALPQQQPDVQIVRSDFDLTPQGGYVYAFETSDGTQRQETGELKTVNDEENKPHDVVVVKGSYVYKDEQGKPVSINYYADESGYHAEGESIPKV
ncbi:insect cuticle protein domain-containing protein [Phthorimaea operculella]|nr:insect cuticle protein domain-containing protein [Phthorimaea operculella]